MISFRGAVAFLGVGLLLIACGDGVGPDPLKSSAEPPLPWVWDGPSVPSLAAPVDAPWDTRYRRAAGQLVQDLALANDTVDLAHLDPEIVGTEGYTAVYNALARVYGRDDLEARDTVVVYCQAATAKGPPVDRLSVDIESAGAWVDAWWAGELRTGQPAVDSLTAKYELRLDTVYDFNHLRDRARFASDRPLNMTGLARLLEGVEGLEDAWPSEYAGTDNWTIGVELEPEGLVLTYRVGWGDCLSGCLAFRWWQFRVDGAGAVSYLGAGGPPLPGPDDPFGYEPVCQGS